MTKRKLVAALACRANGSRLYGKPLQNLEPGYKIIDHILQNIQKNEEIEEIVLGISEGVENAVFKEIAKKYNISFIEGNEKDVLKRLVDCGQSAQATDIFRITTECPFIAWEYFHQAWKNHLTHTNDITVTDYLPEGMNFEIYKLSVLEESHEKGQDDERSEFCSLYARRHKDRFKIGIIKPEKKLQRTDLRVTVDYPEDLILACAIYKELKEFGPLIPIEKIYNFLDTNPQLNSLVKPYVDESPLWSIL